jgi:catechol 2,3-dioxygenase-like lactoylglutathione lyase family enzyme
MLATRGVHHLALNTDDMKATIDFYTSILGMRLIQAIKVPAGTSRGNPPFENIRHYFFDMGNDSTVAFFEIPKAAMPQAERNAIGAMQHVSFAVSQAAADAIRARLAEHHIETLGPLAPAPGILSIYFFDNNGIRLEVTWVPNDAEADISVIAWATQSQSEALAELATLESDPAWLSRVGGHLPT